MSGAIADVIRAMRAVRRERGFFTLAILALAVGIGSTATVFGMVNQLLLRPVPGVADPDQVAYLEFRTGPGAGVPYQQGIAHPDFELLMTNATLLEGLASQGLVSYQVSSDGLRTSSVTGEVVSGDFFRLLGVRPAAGRLFEAAETTPTSNPRIAVISERLSERLFGGADGAVGQTIFLDGQAASVVGVAASGFRGPERRLATDLWIPYAGLVVFDGFPPEVLTGRRYTNHVSLIARVRDGVSVEAAEAQLLEIVQGEGTTFLEGSSRVGRLRPQLEMGLRIPRGERTLTYATLGLFAVAVGLVLLISCANVAILLLVRDLSRRASIATRRALGASPWRILRQHLAESLVLAVLGTVAGVAVGWMVTLLFSGTRLMRMPAFDGFSLDGRVFAFASVIAVLTALLFGTVPAALAGRFDLGAALRGSLGRDPRLVAALRRALSVAQVALSVPLLVGAVLLTRTVGNLYTLDTGVSLDHVWTLSLGTPPTGADPASIAEKYRELAVQVRQVPGVSAAAVDRAGPLSEEMKGQVSVVDATELEPLSAAARPVTAGWFSTVQLTFERGGIPSDELWRPGGETPVVLTASLAAKLFGDRDPMGQRVAVGQRDQLEAVVMGVTSDLRMPTAPTRAADAFFVPLGTLPLPHATLLLRAESLDGNAVAALEEIARATLGAQVSGPPVAASMVLDDLFTEQRLLRRVLLLTGLFALLLAGIGLYGVMAFAVAGRMPEYGVRRALGADATDITARVASECAVLVGAGTSLGLAGAAFFGALIESRLFGVTALDPVSYIVAALSLGLAAVVACWSPARVAASASPLDVLRRG